jgi:hypothetical protein
MINNNPELSLEKKIYFCDYNRLLSNVAKEFNSSFAAIASPTLSKQETVTNLYQSINEGIAISQLRPSFPWRRFIEFLPRVLLKFAQIVYASVRFRVHSIPEGAVVFRTWLVPRGLAGSALFDDYFRQLPEDLAVHEKVVVSFTPTDMGLLNHFGRVRRDDCQIVSYGLLSLLDVLKLFWDYVSTALLKTQQKYILDGSDVTAYINQSFLLDYLGLRSFEAYAEKYKCQKLIQHNIKAFVYVFENQSWEKACCATLRGHGIRLIGYQSSGFSPIFLNFFPTEGDARQHPMPDILLTVGDYFRKYLLEHGHYSIPVELFAALRFSYPTEGNRYAVLPPNLQILGRILYAFPVHIEQYADTINDLIHVFRDSGIAVELKLHPLYRLNDVKGLTTLPDNFRIVTDVAMDSLRDTYDCVLFNDNSFGIEALLKGVKSYQYSRDGSFADDRFMYFKLWQVNYQLADLHRLKNSIQSCSYDKEFDLETVTDYVNGMYRPYTRDAFDRFRELLNSDYSDRVPNNLS